MFEKLKAKIVFHQILKRPDIMKAYKMVGPEDSWYDTITTVHNSLAEIQKLPHEKWELTSHDGLKLSALFYPGTTNKTMIWVHGYTSHAERESAFPGLFYHSLGYNVLIPYLRAHGPSEGKYISFGPMEARDMNDWIKLVNQKTPGSILIHGLSMGGGIALDLATMDLESVKCMVVDAPSYCISEFFCWQARSNSKRHPEKLLNFLYQNFRKEFGVNAEDYDRRENIWRGKYPILFTAGSLEGQDEVMKLMQMRNPHPTEVLILPGCNHGNGMYKQTEMYQDAIRKFSERYM